LRTTFTDQASTTTEKPSMETQWTGQEKGIVLPPGDIMTSVACHIARNGFKCSIATAALEVNTPRRWPMPPRIGMKALVSVPRAPGRTKYAAPRTKAVLRMTA